MANKKEVNPFFTLVETEAKNLKDQYLVADNNYHHLVEQVDKAEKERYLLEGRVSGLMQARQLYDFAKMQENAQAKQEESKAEVVKQAREAAKAAKQKEDHKPVAPDNKAKKVEKKK